MARHKDFDPDLALDNAMRLFWRQGYHATSIQDLVEATGINRASLYATFGGKEALFLAAVERYLAEINRVRIAKLQGNPSPRAAIQGYFDDLVEFAIGDGRRLGCMLTNSAVEFSARFLLTMINGMRVMSRVKPEEGWMRDAISGLDLLFRKADAA